MNGSSHTYAGLDMSLFLKQWPYHTYKWVISHIWTSHMNESCHTYAGLDMSFFLKQWPCHTYDEWVMSHMWIHTCMSLVTYMNESCHTYEWVMSYICRSRHEFLSQAMALFHADGTSFQKSWLVHTCDMRHDSFICVWYETWLVRVCDMTHLFSCCWYYFSKVMTGSHVWHEPWLVRVCDMTRSCVWHETWLVHVCFLNSFLIIDPFKSIFKNRKNRNRFNRFKSI